MTLTGYMSGLFAAVLPKPRTNPKVRRPAVEAAAEAKRARKARPWWASRVQRWRAWRKAYLGRPARMRAIRDAEDGSFRRQREGTRQRLTHYLDGRRFLAEVASLYGRLS